ncbi:MAG: aminopeptidase [Phenylobacterium sp.]|nr:aminopeptidase [Phenylobacterium sp.]
MSASKFLAASLAGLLSATTPAAAAPLAGSDAARSARNMQAHMTFLSSDLLEGREAGSRGFDIAADYVASQFRQLGLTPAGDKGTFFQSVPLWASRPAGPGGLVLKRPAGDIALVFGEDYFPGRTPTTGETRVSAPLVFVGLGVVAPEHGRDDYKGLDVTGKIVVAIAGAPNGLQTEERAYYANVRTKRREAARHGAVGYIALETPLGEKLRPFAEGLRTWDSWAMTWRGRDGQPFDPAPGVPNLATVSVKGAMKLFAGAPLTYAEAVAAADRPDIPSRFDLPASAEVRMVSETRVVESRNVAALLPGADPRLKDEVVVLSAHLDHIGITQPVNGDAINNGTLDNAAGVATTLEVARALSEARKPPRRSVLFLTVTGEEKGLLGAEYFARNPSVPLQKIVADVDIDMPVLTYDFTDVVAFGADRSGVGPAVRRAAARVGLTLSDDPIPEEGLFTRSDHYRFVEVGVPAVFLMTGFANGGEKAFRSFLAHCYHRPCDDLFQPIDYRAGAKFARINYEITRELADMPTRPTWNRGDFFGEKFATGAQRQP